MSLYGWLMNQHITYFKPILSLGHQQVDLQGAREGWHPSRLMLRQLRLEVIRPANQITSSSHPHKQKLMQESQVADTNSINRIFFQKATIIFAPWISASHKLYIASPGAVWIVGTGQVCGLGNKLIRRLAVSFFWSHQHLPASTYKTQ